MPALLRVLFIGFAWLPLTFALHSARSLWYALGDTLAGLDWLLWFLPWVLRSAWVHLTPHLHSKAR